MPREPEAGQYLDKLLEQRGADDNHTEIIRAARALYWQGRHEHLIATVRRLAGSADRTETALAELGLRALWKLSKLHEILDLIDLLSQESKSTNVIVRFKVRTLRKLERWDSLIEYLSAASDTVAADAELKRVLQYALVKRERQEQTVSNLARRPDLLAADLNTWPHHLKSLESLLLQWQRLRTVDPSHEMATRKIESLTAEITRAKRLRVELESDGEWRDDAVSHVAIMGQSYCGSTILGALLGSLDEVQNIGESFWLTHRKLRGNPEITDFGSLEQQQGILFCTTCGADCRIFTPQFRAQLAADPRLWYLKIAQRLGTRILVSSDKNLTKLEQTDPLLRFDGIVLFKSPEQHWWSNLKKIHQKDRRFQPIETLDAFMRRWTRDHRMFLEQIKPRGVKVFLYFDEFCRRPERHRKRLAELLGLTFDPLTPGKVARHQHFFGGNALVEESYRSSNASLRVKPLPPAQIPVADRERLRSNVELQRVWRACMHMYRQQFP